MGALDSNTSINPKLSFVNEQGVEFTQQIVYFEIFAIKRIFLRNKKVRPLRERTKNDSLKVATHPPTEEGERIHFYKDSILPLLGFIRMCSNLIITYKI